MMWWNWKRSELERERVCVCGWYSSSSRLVVDWSELNWMYWHWHWHLMYKTALYGTLLKVVECMEGWCDGIVWCQHMYHQIQIMPQQQQPLHTATTYSFTTPASTITWFSLYCIVLYTFYSIFLTHKTVLSRSIMMMIGYYTWRTPQEARDGRPSSQIPKEEKVRNGTSCCHDQNWWI